MKLIKEIKKLTKNESFTLSGGVDSSVVAMLINKLLKKISCIMVDTGLMRKNEFKYTYKILKIQIKCKISQCIDYFFKKIKGVSNPEKKKNNW